jgi:hypothetical protein
MLFADFDRAGQPAASKHDCELVAAKAGDGVGLSRLALQCGRDVA